MPVSSRSIPTFFCPRVGGEVVEHHLAVTKSANVRPHPHALDLAVLGAEQFDPATAGRSTVIANDEERDRVSNRLLHTETMTALTRIKPCQIRA